MSPRYPLLGTIMLSAVFVAVVSKSGAQTFKSSEGLTPETSSAVVAPSQEIHPSATQPGSQAVFTLSETSQNDSATGWSSFLTPDLGYRLNQHFLVDANLPWYILVEAYIPTTVNGVTSYQLQSTYNVLGDAAATAHFEQSHNDLSYSAAATVAFPTGDKNLGVGAGTTTYYLNNHIEYSIGRFNPDLEAGIGNSSALASPVVKKSYTAVGAIANFQTGGNVDLPRKASLDLELYEAMPVALQNVFGTVEKKGANGKGRNKQVYQGTTASAEDNGIAVELGFPISRNLTLGGDYNCSFIQASQIVGFSLTWAARQNERNGRSD